MYNSYSALNLLGGMLYTMILLVIAYFVLKIVANWKIFEKAGQPGWASIVPFYSNYIEFNIYQTKAGKAHGFNRGRCQQLQESCCVR